MMPSPSCLLFFQSPSYTDPPERTLLTHSRAWSASQKSKHNLTTYRQSKRCLCRVFCSSQNHHRRLRLIHRLRLCNHAWSRVTRYRFTNKTNTIRRRTGNCKLSFAVFLFVFILAFVYHGCKWSLAFPFVGACAVLFVVFELADVLRAWEIVRALTMTLYIYCVNKASIIRRRATAIAHGAHAGNFAVFIIESECIGFSRASWTSMRTRFISVINKTSIIRRYVLQFWNCLGRAFCRLQKCLRIYFLHERA